MTNLNPSIYRTGGQDVYTKRILATLGLEPNGTHDTLVLEPGSSAIYQSTGASVCYELHSSW